MKPLHPPTNCFISYCRLSSLSSKSTAVIFLYSVCLIERAWYRAVNPKSHKPFCSRRTELSRVIIHKFTGCHESMNSNLLKALSLKFEPNEATFYYIQKQELTWLDTKISCCIYINWENNCFRVCFSSPETSLIKLSVYQVICLQSRIGPVSDADDD